MKIKAIYLLLIILSQMACTQFIDLNDDTIEPILVLNSVITPDSTIKVELYHNTSIYEVKKMNVPNAEVILFENGKELDKLKLQYNVTENPYFDEVVGGVQFDTTFFYTSAKAIAKQGCSYKITASAPGFDAVSALTTIPEPMPIVRIDTSSAYQYFYDSINTYGTESLIFNFDIFINDQANTENYYRLVMCIENGRLRTDTTGVEPIDYIMVSKWGDQPFKTQSAVFTTQNEDANSNIIGAPQNKYKFFNDELFDGKEYPLELRHENITNWHGRKGEIRYKMKKGEFYHFTFYLHSITKATYLYFKSFDMQFFYHAIPFIEPVTVYSNVENGAGVFGSYSVSKYEVTFGEYPIEGMKYR
jgi:hypothetical protein